MNVETLLKIAAVVATIGVLWFELYRRRKLLQEELEFKRKEFAEAQKDRQEALEIKRKEFEEVKKERQEALEFKRSEFEEAKKEREERLDFIKRETVRLVDAGALLGEHVARNLKSDVTWAAKALNIAKLGPHAKSMFAERSLHFRDEKDHVGQHFVPLLLQRCRELAKNTDRIYILIDSGTTLFPIFGKLGSECVQLAINKEEWLSKLTIITNNLPGVESLIETGLLNPTIRNSQLVVNCRLLPGMPLPVYSAIAGQETQDALGALRQDSQKGKAVFIGLVTGNWIRIQHEKEARYPVPLARELEHVRFKQVLMDCSDEIFVIGPLGKIFLDATAEDINTVLGFSDTNLNPDRHPYNDVISEKKTAARLVSTERDSHHLLHQLSLNLRRTLRIPDFNVQKFVEAGVGQAPHLLFPFHKLPSNRQEEIEIEFPHAYTRKPELMKNHFFVTS